MDVPELPRLIAGDGRGSFRTAVGWERPYGIWSLGGLPKLHQLSCAVGTLPVFYHPEERLPSSKAGYTVSNLFSYLSLGGDGP